MFADFRRGRILSFIENHLVLLKQVIPMGVDGDDQRAEFPDPAVP